MYNKGYAVNFLKHFFPYLVFSFEVEQNLDRGGNLILGGFGSFQFSNLKMKYEVPTST